MKKTALIFSILISITNLVYAQTCKEVIGYYPNWQWYQRNALVNPKTIDYGKYTILNYSFFKPNVSGKIDSTDAWADENLLLGEHDWSKGDFDYKPNTSLISLAHNNGVKVMVSIGGWTLSNEFPAIAANATKRQIFANECVRLIKKYNFDGIDIDWEYPGFAEHSGTIQDKENFTLLMQSIRTAIDSYGTSVNKKYLLTAAFSAVDAHAKNIEWDKIKSILDMINLMTYDFFGSFDEISNHNSPLFSPEMGDSTFNINSAFLLLTKKYNISPDKINLGIPFYGRTFAKCKGLFQSHSGSDAVLFPNNEGIPSYFDILKKRGNYTRYWDNKAKVPFALTSSGTLISYDDEESVGLKAEYIVKNNAKGCIIWDITGDYIEGAPGIVENTPLVNKIKTVFCTLTTDISKENKSIPITNHPNPVIDILNIRVEYPSKIIIYDTSGKKFLEKPILAGESNINVQNLAPGIYVYTIENNNQANITSKFIIK